MQHIFTASLNFIIYYYFYILFNIVFAFFFTGAVRHDDMPPGVQNNYQSRENTIQVTSYNL